jgi:hypothetical protein
MWDVVSVCSDDVQGDPQKHRTWSSSGGATSQPHRSPDSPNDLLRPPVHTTLPCPPHRAHSDGGTWADRTPPHERWGQPALWLPCKSNAQQCSDESLAYCGSQHVPVAGTNTSRLGTVACPQHEEVSWHEHMQQAGRTSPVCSAPL